MSGHEDLLGLAMTVAAEAAELVLGMRAEGVDVAGTKSSSVDIVTRADHAAEELIRTRLLSARPDDGFLGEEGDAIPTGSGVRWVVDPIDGTVNYLYGYPQYAVSVAAELQGDDGSHVVASVVHAPALKVVYTATRGGGAFCDGRPLAVRDVVAMNQRLIATGFNYRRDVRTAQASYVARLLPRVRDIRRAGSSALDVCDVAAGRSDGYVEEGTYPWDDAAAGLIATEAGARFAVLTSPSGNRVTVCAPGGGFADFVEVIEDCGFIAPGAGNVPGDPDVV